MKKNILLSLLSIISTGSFATGVTSSIESVRVASINRMDSSTYEIFAMTNTQDSMATLTNAFAFTTRGTYTTDDIKTFLLYRNTSNTMDGAVLIGTAPATAAGKQTIAFRPISMPSNTTMYYMISAKAGDAPTEGHTIYISGISNIADSPFSFVGTQPDLAPGKAAGFWPMRFSGTGELVFAPKDIFEGCRLGISGGFTTMYGDLEKSHHKAALQIDFSKQTSVGIVLDVQLQHGSFSSYTPAKSWTTGLCETNHYNALNINGRYVMSSCIKNPKNVFTKIISKCYAGAGIGVIDNSLAEITNKFKESDTKTLAPDMKTSSIAAVLPMNLGINIDLKKLVNFHSLQLNINYQITYAFSDYVDGYSFATATARNNYNDVYSILSVGLSCYLGNFNVWE